MARRERLEKGYAGLLPIVQTLSKSDWETLRSFFDEMFRKKAAEVRLDSEKDSKIIENCFKLHVLNEPLSSIIPPASPAGKGE